MRNSIVRRRIVRLYDYPTTLFEGAQFFEENGPIYVIEPLVETRNRELLNEGLAKGLAKDALQFAVGAAAEYGLMATGGGAPAAPAVETAVDAAFAVDSVAGVVTAVKNVASNVGEFAKLLNGVLESAKNCVNDPENFYKNVKGIISKGLVLLGKKSEGKIDDLVKKLKEVVENVITKIVDAIAEGIKLLVPDATAGGTIASSVRVALEKFAENSYSMLTGAVEKTGKFKKFLSDSETTKNFFGDLYDKLIKLCEDFSKKIENTGWLKSAWTGLKTIGGAGVGAGVIIKKFGPEGFRNLSKFLSEKKEGFLNLIGTIVDVVIPAAYSMMAIFQILMKGEYKQSENKDEDKKSEEKGNKTESYVRNVYGRNKVNVIDTERWKKLAKITSLCASNTCS